MPMTAACLLLLAAFVCALMGAVNKCPWWVPMILTIVAALLGCLPK